jgi:CopG family nickel-responsive transcriptional regulator
MGMFITNLIINSFMPIVSISLNDELLTEIDKLQKSMGFTGRSEIIRAGIRSFVSEEKQKDELSGSLHAILLVVHNDEFDDIIAGLKHSFEDLIITHLHSKIHGNKCVELFMLDGDAERVGLITRNFKVNKKMDTVKLVTL